MDNSGNLIHSISLNQHQSFTFWWKLNKILIIIVVSIFIIISCIQLWKLIAIRQASSALEEHAKRYQTIQNTIEQEKMNVKKLNEIMNKCKHIKQNIQQLICVMADISSCLPDDVKLTSYGCHESNISMEGISKAFVSITDFVHQLKNNAVFKNVQLIWLKPQENHFQFSMNIECMKNIS